MGIKRLVKDAWGISRVPPVLSKRKNFLFLICFIFLVFPVSANVFTNPGFENGATGWTLYTDAGYGTNAVTTGVGGNTGHVLQIFPYGADSVNRNYYASQNIDLTSCANLSFDYYLQQDNNPSGEILNVKIDNVSIFSSSASSLSFQHWTTINIPISVYSGVHTFSVYWSNGATYADIFLDNFSSGNVPSNEYYYNSPSNSPIIYNWICPGGVTQVAYSCYGPGGHGGRGGTGTTVPLHSGGGGGGGASGGVVSGYSSVTPGQSYTITLNSSGSYFDVLANSPKGADGGVGIDANPFSPFDGNGGLGAQPDGASGGGASGQDHFWVGIGGHGNNVMNNGVLTNVGSGGNGGWGMFGCPALGWPSNYGFYPSSYPWLYYFSWSNVITTITNPLAWQRDPGQPGALGAVVISPIIYNGNNTGNTIPANNVSIQPILPVASCTCNPNSGSAPLSVSFTDTSSNNPTSWYWNFGDGNTSTSENPSHTYYAVGKYYVSFKAINANGSTWYNNTYVTVNPSSPICNFIVTPSSGNAPLNCNFYDSSENDVNSWSWNFGDGTNSNSKNPTHVYNSQGTYTITETVTSSGGSNSTSKVLNVYNGNAPVTSFSASPTIGKAPLSVSFTDASQGATSWLWDFGDGNTSASQNPSHTYYNGIWAVRLTTTNAYGSSDLLKIAYISVSSANTSYPVPVANFNGYPTIGFSPMSVGFTDTSSGSPTSWSWNFGDGNTSSLQNPTNTYYNVGNYNIQLIATNQYGSSAIVKNAFITIVQNSSSSFSNTTYVNNTTYVTLNNSSYITNNNITSINTTTNNTTWNIFNTQINNFYNYTNNTETSVSNTYDYLTNTTDTSNDDFNDSLWVQSIKDSENALNNLFLPIINFVASIFSLPAAGINAVNNTFSGAVYDTAKMSDFFSPVSYIWTNLNLKIKATYLLDVCCFLLIVFLRR